MSQEEENNNNNNEDNVDEEPQLDEEDEQKGKKKKKKGKKETKKSKKKKEKKKELDPQLQEELINEITEKEKYIELLITSNSELKAKIELSNSKYDEILSEIKIKEKEKTEASLAAQIRQIENQIESIIKQTDKYKKQINQLQQQINFKDKVDKSFNLELELESLKKKNKDLKYQYDILITTIKNQQKCINDYEQRNHVKDKMDILKNEIQNAKNKNKEFQERYFKEERFIRMIHQKICEMESIIKTLKQPKPTTTKSFTYEQFTETIESIRSLQGVLTITRERLAVAEQNYDEKLHVILQENKAIEEEYKTNVKLYKTLIKEKGDILKKIETSKNEGKRLHSLLHERSKSCANVVTNNSNNNVLGSNSNSNNGNGNQIEEITTININDQELTVQGKFMNKEQSEKNLNTPTAFQIANVMQGEN